MCLSPLLQITVHIGWTSFSATNTWAQLKKKGTDRSWRTKPAGEDELWNHQDPLFCLSVNGCDKLSGLSTDCNRRTHTHTHIPNKKRQHYICSWPNTSVCFCLFPVPHNSSRLRQMATDLINGSKDIFLRDSFFSTVPNRLVHRRWYPCEIYWNLSYLFFY